MTKKDDHVLEVHDSTIDLGEVLRNYLKKLEEVNNG